MVRLGKAYGNLMVDLRATNSKLRARTTRIVRIVVGGRSTYFCPSCQVKLRKRPKRRAK